MNASEQYIIHFSLFRDCFTPSASLHEWPIFVAVTWTARRSIDEKQYEKV